MRWPWTRRLVRLHLTGELPSVEGILVGFWCGHYVIRLPRVIESADASVSLEGPEVRVDRARVVFVQVLR